MKAQSDIIAMIIIVIISISLVSFALLWGLPLIQKRQDESIVNRVDRSFDTNNANSLPNKIVYIAKNKGEDTFTSETDGVWALNEYDSNNPGNMERNYIEFSFLSKASKIAANNEWIPNLCGKLDGILGENSAIVCGKTNVFQDNYNITYKIWFRRLKETDNRYHMIGLIKDPRGVSFSVGKNVRIMYDSVEEKTYSGITYIITKVKILLE